MELLKQEKEQLFRTEENLTKDQQVQFLRQPREGREPLTNKAGEVTLLSRTGGEKGLR